MRSSDLIIGHAEPARELEQSWKSPNAGYRAVRSLPDRVREASAGQGADLLVVIKAGAGRVLNWGGPVR